MILRFESTTSDLSFFKHYREVEQHDGQRVMKWAPLKRSIHSLTPLERLLAAANRRYLEFLSTLDDPSDGVRALRRVSKTLVEQERTYRGFNFFDEADQQLFELIARGEFNISGFQNKNLRRHLPQKTCAQVSRLLKRLRVHGLIRRVASTYKYYLTKLGQRVLLAGLKLKEFFLIPQLAAQLPA